MCAGDDRNCPDFELHRQKLLDDLDTDTRNVLLTFARIWQTVVTGEIPSKDEGAAWAIERLPAADRAPLETARTMYLEGWDRDAWGEDLPAARAAANALVDGIRREMAAIDRHEAAERR